MFRPRALLALLLPLTVLASTAVAAERFDVQARVEPEKVQLGGTFTLVVEVERAEGDRLALDAAPSSEKVRPAGPINRSVVRAAEKGRVKETLRIPFLALDYEEASTPELILVAPDGALVKVESVPVVVEDPLLKEPAAKELEPQPAARMAWFSSWDRRPFMALCVLLMGLIGVLIGWLQAKMRKDEVALPVVINAVQVPADIEALQRLDALLAEGLLARGEVTVFVSRLMDEVLRFYIEGRFQVPAGRSTTRELAEQLLSVGHPSLDSELVQRILESADLVKFARADVAAASAQRTAGQVRELIESTRPRARAGDEEAA